MLGLRHNLAISEIKVMRPEQADVVMSVCSVLLRLMTWPCPSIWCVLSIWRAVRVTRWSTIKRNSENLKCILLFTCKWLKNTVRTPFTCPYTLAHISFLRSVSFSSSCRWSWTLLEICQCVIWPCLIQIMDENKDSLKNVAPSALICY